MFGECVSVYEYDYSQFAGIYKVIFMFIYKLQNI
jgi:hypothetical protein